MTTTPQTFADLRLPPPLLSALAEVGYETPSPIQAACIPVLLDGEDILGEAQTGTGKTAAFALPLLARLDLALAKPQALVLTPTRELAIQVAEALQKYAHHMPGFHVLPLYGGQSMVVQLRALSRGTHVIVGTPGRIMDHLERKSLSLDALKMLVLDEADEMLRMGFVDDVDWILEHTPATRQTALFSATMPEPIRRIAHRHLRQPREIKIKAATTTVAAIRQVYCQVHGNQKLDALTRILEVEEDFDAAIIFVRTKLATVEVADKLEARGYAVAPLNGDMTQGLREQVIERLKSGSLDVVVATDVAARGIDVPRISHVVNYDVPYDTEAYVHRIGRTGRAGRKGNAILFVAPREMRLLRDIERATRQKIEPVAPPTHDEVAERRVQQFKQQIADTIESEELEFFFNIIRQMEEERSLSARQIAAALAWQSQRDRPLQPEPGSLPAIPAPPREERAPRENRDKILAQRRAFSDGKLARYRIEVGRNQGVLPKEIVGALANEGGIDGRYIGQINLFDDFSIVELPADLTPDLIGELKRIRVRQTPISLRPVGADEYAAPPPRPRFRKEGDAPRREAGDRPPRPPYQGERTYGDRKPPFREERSFGDKKPPFSGERSFGDKKPPFKSERSFGDKKPPFKGERSFGDKKPPFKGERGDRPFSKKPPHK